MSNIFVSENWIFFFWDRISRQEKKERNIYNNNLVCVWYNHVSWLRWDAGNQKRQFFTLLLRDRSSQLSPHIYTIYLPLLFRLCRSSFFIKRHRLWWIVIFNFHIHKFQGSYHLLSLGKKIIGGYQFMISKKEYI